MKCWVVDVVRAAGWAQLSLSKSVGLGVMWREHHQGPLPIMAGLEGDDLPDTVVTSLFFFFYHEGPPRVLSSPLC